MKCPNDKTEMEKGNLFSYGKTSWAKGFFDTKGKAITAFRCPTCGKVELTTEAK